MTLKEKVAEMEPEKIRWYLSGGVFGCPSDYAYLNCERNATNCGKGKLGPPTCAECWNREFVPKEEDVEKEMSKRKQLLDRLWELCGIYAMEAYLKSRDESDKPTETTKTPSAVSHPSHYNQGGIECIDAIKAATVGLNGFEGFCAGNALKYLWRWKHKNGVEDLKKCQWYLDRLIEEQEEQE